MHYFIVKHKRDRLATMHKTVNHFIGWCGTALILGGYLLLSLGIFTNDWPYHTCMLIGSLCIVYISSRDKLWEVVVLNVCFAIIALVALIRLFFLA